MDPISQLAGAVDGMSETPAPAVKPIADAPAEADKLAQEWNKRLETGRKRWEKFHRRVRHSRAVVAGFNWSADPTTTQFNKHRANLIQGTITGILPQIYARNPELSVTPTHKGKNLKLFCETLTKVTNRHLERADLKGRAKATVRAALTTSFGAIKLMYQRDIKEDPVIKSRIQDTQDNLQLIEGLLAECEDPTQQADMEAKKQELAIAMDALNERLEVVAAEGLVIDRILTDNLIIDPSVCEFWDYKDAGWIAQIIPMMRSEAERKFNVKLDKATPYKPSAAADKKDGRLASGGSEQGDCQIAVVEVWDKATGNVLTLAEGCDFFLRQPYRPVGMGERWYPFFLLPFQLVDGEFIGPSLVDLTEKLQEEHNEARDRFNKHRDLAIPGWVAAGDTNEKTLKNFAKSVSVEGFGEIVIVDTEGKPLNQVVAPKQHPPIDPMVYDTANVRYDWEQVTGLQDAARSTVVQPKTATEASIMNQALSGRVSEFRDQVEDWLSEISQCAAEMLLLELSRAQVERIMGPHQEKVEPGPDGALMPKIEPAYDWPELSREDVFDMVEVKVRAGTTGQPDKAEQQEAWTKVLPVIKELVAAIVQARQAGLDDEPFIAMLRVTLARFDERLEVEQFIPKKMQPPALPPMGAMPVQPGPTAGAPVMPMPAMA